MLRHVRKEEMAGLWPRLDWLVGPAVSAAVSVDRQEAGRPGRRPGDRCWRRSDRWSGCCTGFSTHRKPGLSCVSMACGRSDELAGLPAGEKLASGCGRGNGIVDGDLWPSGRGFFAAGVAHRGADDAGACARGNVTFLVDYTALTTPDGQEDSPGDVFLGLGVVGGAGQQAGSALGRLSGLRTGCVPVVAIHPCDERRGYLPSALDMVKGLLAAGHEPVTFRELVRMHR